MRVAVVGSGVAGLGAAYVLARAHEVEVFEREERPGGHVNTVSVDGLALDTGFLVHNERNYPLLGRLFRELGIRTQESDMSFSVSCIDCGLEYAGRRPFAQARNAASAHFHGAPLGDRALAAHRPPVARRAGLDGWSLGRYLDEHGYSQRFRRHFLVPLTSALWSTAPARALELPAAYAIRFFDNHGMLGFRRFRWRSVVGGSRTYVDAVAERLGGRSHSASPVRSVRRDPDGVEVRTADGERAPLRRGGRRHARRPGARAARGSDRRRATAARRVLVHAQRRRPPHGRRRSCPARRPPGRPGTTG